MGVRGYIFFRLDRLLFRNWFHVIRGALKLLIKLGVRCLQVRMIRSLVVRPTKTASIDGFFPISKPSAERRARNEDLTADVPNSIPKKNRREIQQNAFRPKVRLIRTDIRTENVRNTESEPRKNVINRQSLCSTCEIRSQWSSGNTRPVGPIHPSISPLVSRRKGRSAV